MANRFTEGKRAIAECDRCGFRFKLHDLKKLVVKTKQINMLVCSECWEEDHPQLQLGMYPIADPQALRDPRPDFAGYPASRAVIVAVSSYLSGLERTFATGQVGNIFFPDAVDVTVLLLGVGATSLVSSGSSVITTADIFAVGNQANSALGIVVAGVDAAVQVTGVQGASVIGNDPYYSDNILLLHMDGANGGTTFTDNSPTPKTVTANGNAVTNTAIVKYGTASALFDGSGDYLQFPLSTQLSASNFTIEGWFNPSAINTNAQCLFSSLNSNVTNGLEIAYTSAGIYFQVKNGPVSSAVSSDVYFTISANTWYHFAVVKNGVSYTMYLNGVGGVPGTFGGIWTDTANATIGAVVASTTFYYVNGRIDDFRITKGVARYTANFTPPTAAFIDGAYITGTAAVQVTGVQGTTAVNPLFDPLYSQVALLLHADGTNGSTTFLDSSRYRSNLSIALGTPSLNTAVKKFGTASIRGPSGNYPASATYIYAPITPSSGTGSWTWETWVNRAADRDYFGFYAQTNFRILIRSPGNSGNYSMLVDVNGFNYLGSTVTVTLNTWVHVAVTYEAITAGTGTWRIFQDGVLTASRSGGPVNVGATTDIIGVTDQAGFSGLDGYLDEYRLTIGTARYTSNFTPPTGPFIDDSYITGTANVAVTGVQGATAVGALVNDPFYSNVTLLLHMDGANGGTTFTDNSPSPKTVTPGGNTQTNTSIVKYGTASAAFDGAGDYLSVPDSLGLQFAAGDFTVEFWIKTAVTNTLMIVLSKGTNEFVNYGNLTCYIDTDNRIKFYCNPNSGDTSGRVTVSSTTNVTNDQWFHVAATRSGNTWRMFINGAQESSIVSSVGYQTETNPFYVGCYLVNSLPGSFFTGYIDDLRITKGVARYTANFTPPTAAFPDS